jgi:hypothetical protein
VLGDGVHWKGNVKMIMEPPRARPSKILTRRVLEGGVHRKGNEKRPQMSSR